MKRSALVLSLVIAGSGLMAGCALFGAAKRAPQEVTVERTPQRVARGAYLVNSVNACMACHSPLEADTHLPVQGKVGAGGRLFGREDGLPGNIYSTNLTPDPETGLGAWTDGEVLRAMREGVSRDGHALFPLMPYPMYHRMSDEDAHAIVAYLRTLKPIENPVPKRELDFPLSLIVNTMPQPLTGPVPNPPSAKENPVARGEYIVAMSSCIECHTPMGGAGPDMSRMLGGGHMFKSEGHAIRMPNITPDKETGIGGWTDAQIEAAIRYGQKPSGDRLSPVMPWMVYNGMSKEDMDSVVAYLRTVKPVKTEAAKQ